ncbi:MAG: hypothetical protein SVU88_04540 [Candidatus Nanohaloarchaea archaeon]|nr:hypothetical protein [Candidatus Nanohaloarchaea archaeon]
MDADEVIRRIETVDIQGATAVARTGIELLQELAADGAAEERIETVEERLRAARPTEPLLFNAIAAGQAHGYDTALQHIETAQDDIADRAAALLAEEGVETVYTHCHSSTVTAALQRASQDRALAVRVTETRPLYQGRETARELADAGIPVTLSVDAAAGNALAEADVMLIGADAIAPDGAVYNKIGSGLFAATAARRDVPVYVLADAWKLDGDVTVEERGREEVWADAPDAVDVRNPAFERVAPGDITGIVSELGTHRPNAFMDAVEDAYPEIAP